MNHTAKTMILSIGIGAALGIGFGALGNRPGIPSPSKPGSQERNNHLRRETANQKAIPAPDLSGPFSIASGSDRIKALVHHYSRLHPDQFPVEAAKLDALPDHERHIAAAVLFSTWGEIDPTGALSMADTRFYMEGTFERTMVLRGWASTDPVNAAKYLAEHPESFASMALRDEMGARPASAAGIIAEEWAKHDPEAAMQWAAGLMHHRNEVVSSVIHQVASADPTMAVGFADALPEDERANAYQIIAGHWIETQPEKAMAWIHDLPEHMRAEAWSSAVRSMAEKDPEHAAEQIAGITDTSDRRELESIAAASFARTNVNRSLDWVLSLEDELSRIDSLRKSMPILAASGSQQVLDYIAREPSAEVRSDAAMQYIRHNRDSPPADLLELANHINMDWRRSIEIERIARMWLQLDGEAATQFIRESDSIHDDRREHLLQGQ